MLRIDWLSGLIGALLWVTWSGEGGLRGTISARQTCFCGALRSFKITFSRLRSEGFNVMDIPVRMRQTRTSRPAWESQMGFKCQTGTANYATLPYSPKIPLAIIFFWISLDPP